LALWLLRRVGFVCRAKANVPNVGSHRILFFSVGGVFLIFLKHCLCVGKSQVSKLEKSVRSVVKVLSLNSSTVAHRVSANGSGIAEGGDF